MKLDQFIRQSLLDIKNGLREANEEIAKADGGKLGENKQAHFQMGPSSDEFGKISFDIAVTIEKSSKKEADAKIKILEIGGGVGTDHRKRNESTSRIKFHVQPSKHTG